MRIERVLAKWSVILLVLGCVSRTTSSVRFTESTALASPSDPVVADPNNFSFAVVGDLHIGQANTDRYRRILDAALAEGDEFIVLLGDIVDQGERTDLEAVRNETLAAGWQNKTFYVAGNHDVFYDGWTHYRDLLGSSTYAFTAGNSRFIALETSDATLGKLQIDWLKGKLAEARPQHTFLLSHYLPVIPGQSTWLKLADSDEALDLMSLASSQNVTGWLGAHYHSYIHEKIEGVDYVVAGGGGGRRMAPVAGYFYVKVTVNGANVSYELRSIP